LSGSHHKAPGFAGGYLLTTALFTLTNIPVSAIYLIAQYPVL
jgi:hypothetical protein